MKLSKRLLAVFMASSITLSSGAITAFAYPTFRSGGHDVNKILVAGRQSAAGGTSCSEAKAEYLVTFTTAAQYDKNGNKGKLDIKDSYAYNAYHSGGAKISCSGSNRYKSVTSTHGAKYKGYDETASNLTKTVK